MKKNVWLADRAHILAAILIIVQPVMDVVSYWLTEFEISNAPTLLLRMGVLVLAVLCAFIISDRKYIYYIAAAVMAAIYAGHAFACYQAGVVNIVDDFANYVRVVQMPLLVMVFITFMRRNDKAFDYIQLGASVALLFMFAIEIISTITGTDPHTYSDGSGIIGWFFNTNSQSNNLSMLAPVLLIWQLNWKKRRPVLVIASAIVCCLSMYLFATRLAYLGLMATTVGLGVMIFFLRKKEWKIGVVFIALAIVFAALLPVSPTMKHLNLSNKAQDDRQHMLDAALSDKRDDIDSLINKLPGAEEEGEESVESGKEEEEEEEDKITEDEKKLLVEQLTPIYEKYVGDFVKRFGAEETMEMYNYTLDVRTFASLRAKKLMFAEMLMQDSPASAKLFGVEISRFYFEGTIYDVENDFHGIYFLYGWIGFAAYMLFMAYFAFIIVKALIKNFKKYFTLDAVAYGVSLIVCLVHCYNTAGVLRRPNSSVYLSVVLAVIYYLIYIRNYDKEVTAEVE